MIELEMKRFLLVKWRVVKYPTFIHIYDEDGVVLFTLKNGETYDNGTDRYINIDKMLNDLSIAIRKEGSLDKMDVLSDKYWALEHAKALAETLE